MATRTGKPALLTLSLAVALVAATHAAHAQVTAPPKESTKAKAKSKETPKDHLDLNKATAKEMIDTLPGVGEATANKIIEGRPYATVDDLAKAGIPSRTIEAIRPHVHVTVAPKPVATKRVMPKAGVIGPSAAAVPTAKVNLNTGTLKELETLQGIGPVTAKAIMDGRPYKSVDELEKVKGLSKAKIEAIRDHVVVATPIPRAPVTETPTAPGTSTKTMTKKTVVTRPSAGAVGTSAGKLVNLNTATSEELDALPGIGPVKAKAIIEARPFKTIEDVMKVKGIKDGEFSKIKDRITVD